MKSLLSILTFLSWIFFSCCGNKSNPDRPPAIAAKPKPALVFKTDKRVETLYMVFLFSDYPVMTTYSNAYKSAALAYFGPFKNHRAITLAKDLVPRGFVADYAVNWLFQYSEFPKFEKTRTVNFPFEVRPIDQDSLALFAQALRDFYVKAKCDSFFSAQQAFLNAMTVAVKDSFTRKDIIKVIEDYFGVHKAAEYVIILSPLMHSGGFAIERTDVNELYALVGPNGGEGALPQFDRTFLEQDLVIHEFSHNYGNPIVDRYRAQTQSLEKDLFPPIMKQVQAEGYGNWHAFLQELLIRATTIRIVEHVYGQKAATELMDYEKSVGFAYVTTLTEALKTYESQRSKYPDLSAFYPEIISGLEGLRNKRL